MDNPLDVGVFEHFVVEIHSDPCKYPQIIQILRDQFALTDKNEFA